jgi:hypothetical protein
MTNENRNGVQNASQDTELTEKKNGRWDNHIQWNLRRPYYNMVLVDGLYVEEKGLRKQTQNSYQSCPIYVICCLIKLLLESETDLKLQQAGTRKFLNSEKLRRK